MSFWNSWDVMGWATYRLWKGIMWSENGCFTQETLSVFDLHCILISLGVLLQVHPHPDGVLVIPGWPCDLLLLHRTRDSSLKHLLHHQVQEQSKSESPENGAVFWRWFLVYSCLVLLPQKQGQELFPLGNSCAVCGKVKCKRHRYVNRDSEQTIRSSWPLWHKKSQLISCW